MERQVCWSVQCSSTIGLEKVICGVQGSENQLYAQPLQIVLMNASEDGVGVPARGVVSLQELQQGFLCNSCIACFVSS